jgi:hypothetical protein
MTKLSRIIFITSLSALLCFGPTYPALAGTVSLNPTANVTALSNMPNTGNTDVLVVLHTPAPVSMRNWFFLQFDLSPIPAGSTIDDAALSLVHTNQGPPALKTRISVFRCTKVWD